MESKQKFGLLLSILREERNLSRSKLAKKSGLPESIIENIEGGIKAKIEIDYLVKLANGLELTSMDRREFFLAAITDLDASKLVRPRNNKTSMISPDPLKTKEYLIHSIAALRIPAFVSDVYCDVIAANKIMLYFLGITPKLIEDMKTMAAGYNSMRVVFSDISGFQELMDDVWIESMRMNMRHFRRDGFRYQTEDYHVHTKKALGTIPQFLDYWKRRTSEFDDQFVDIDHIEFFHKKLEKNIHYVITQTMALTEYGELYVTSYLPANPDTEDIFYSLARQVDNEVNGKMNESAEHPKNMDELKIVRLAFWPNKTFYAIPDDKKYENQ